MENQVIIYRRRRVGRPLVQIVVEWDQVGVRLDTRRVSHSTPRSKVTFPDWRFSGGQKSDFRLGPGVYTPPIPP